jgi:hypothetical protein
MTVRRAFAATGSLLCAALASCGARTSLDDGVAREPPSAEAGALADAARDVPDSSVDGNRDAPSDTGLEGPTQVVLDAPRPVAPLSTSRVTSRRPTLRWTLPSGVDGATVDLCLDRACTRPIGAPALVQGTSYAPASDLPTGIVYWRLHPSTAAAVTSPTWELTVGARSAPVDTSWGSTLDVNGDGYADLVVAAAGMSSSTGSVYVYLGSATGLATAPATTLIGPEGEGWHFGASLASAGDVNGDGYADLVVGSSNLSSGSPARAYLYLGAPTGLASAPATTLTSPQPVGPNYFGSIVAGAGDVNGDGYADIVVGSLDGAFVYLGSAAGLATTPTPALVPASGSGFGSPVASAGDVNGDGYGDLVVGSPGGGNWGGHAYVFLGSATGLATAPTTTLAAGGPTFGETLASAGDVNGDGYADVVVGEYYAANETGAVYIFLGSATGLATTPATLLTGLDGTYGSFGQSAASAGDVNGDGYADIIVGAPGASLYAGRAYVYLGGALGLANGPAAALTGPDGANGYFGWSVASSGDVYGDGYAGVVVGALQGPSYMGSAYAYSGSASGLAVVPATALTGADANGLFGGVVFGASN